jgi:hypothetical protein
MFRNWLKRLTSTTPVSRRPQVRGRVRPSLEALEDRRVMSATAAASFIGGGNLSFVAQGDGSLDLYNGSKQVSELVSVDDAYNHKGIAQVSASEHYTPSPGILNFPGPAAFVRFGDGTVTEYYHNGGPGWASVDIATGTSAISASQVTNDAVFILSKGGVHEHVGTNPNAGWSTLYTGGNLFWATQIGAGKDAATGNEAVFVKLNTSTLYEHVGKNPNKGWSTVTSGVTDFSASQVQGDTVFVLKKGALSEYVKGTGTFIANNVFAVSAGEDAKGQAAAFVLGYNGILREHTGMKAGSGWTTIASDVNQMDGSQCAADTVFYSHGGPGDPEYQVYQHSGKTDQLIYEWDTPF